MAKVAKILPLPVEPKAGELSTRNALAEKGHMRHPGTGVGFVPIRSVSGKFLTGLDENASYINLLPSSEQEIEREKVKDRRERLERETGLDLGPRSEFYSGVYGPKYGTNEVATRVKLIDGENVFNFANAHKEIEFWWVIQNTALIASSLEGWKKGNFTSTVQFYVSNPEEEASIIYSEKKAQNKAVKSFEAMSLEKRKKVAKLLGLPITDDAKEEVVYIQLDAFIKSGEVANGEYKGQRSVALFNQIAGLTDGLLTTKALIKDALTLRVYNKKSGLLYEGMNKIADSEEDLIRELSSTKEAGQQAYLALEILVNDKKKNKLLIS